LLGPLPNQKSLARLTKSRRRMTIQRPPPRPTQTRTCSKSWKRKRPSHTPKNSKIRRYCSTPCAPRQPTPFNYFMRRWPPPPQQQQQLLLLPLHRLMLLHRKGSDLRRPRCQRRFLPRSPPGLSHLVHPRPKTQPKAPPQRQPRNGKRSVCLALSSNAATPLLG
jgi:hypothetical protein